MHNISEKLKAKFKDYGSTKLMYIATMDSGETQLYLDMDDIVLNTVSFEQILEPSENLTFTGCNASILKFRSKDDVTQLEGRPISMCIGANISEVPGTEQLEYVYLFTGIVDSVKNCTPLQASMDVVAYDLMKVINELDVTAWYNSLPFEPTGLLTLGSIKSSLFSEIYNRIKSKYDIDIQFSNYAMPNDYVYIPKNLDDSHIYAGDILKSMCQINGRYCQMRGYTCCFISFEKEGLYPSTILYPDYDLYPSGVASDENIFNASYKLGSLEFEKYTTATIDGVRLIDKDNHEVAYEGAAYPLNIFTVSGNPLIYGLEQEALDEIAENLYEEIDGILYVPLKLDMIGLPYLECGDYINVQVQNETKSTYILHRVLSGEQALTDHIETLGSEYLPEFKPNTDDKIREAISKARNETRQMISEYDIAVNIMNDLAVNAIGGYQDYEDAESGGRIYYLSNRPIVKNAQGKCVFEIGSTVFKNAGDGLYVSLDGGTTWTNGYNATTGRLVVNVLNAIGISADWIKTGSLLANRIRGGTLLIGGVNNDDGRILACTENSEELTEDIFNGIGHELFVFGEGSDLPYAVGKSYAINESITTIVQPVYYNEPIDSETPVSYFRAVSPTTPDDVWIEYYFYITSFTEPVYAVAYRSADNNPLLVVYSYATFSGKYKIIRKNSGSDPTTSTTNFTASSSYTPATGRRYYYYSSNMFSSYIIDGNNIDPKPAVKEESATVRSPESTLSYIVLDGEHFTESYDLDWYYENDYFPGSYIPAGTHVHYVTDTFTAKTQNDEHTYECFLQPNCYAVVIKDKNTGMLQHLIMCLGTQSYYTRIIDGGAPDRWDFIDNIHYFVGEQDLWYARLGGMYSSTLSITDANFVYTDDSQFPEIVRQIGIVIYGEYSVNHGPNVAFLPPKTFGLGFNVSNISDPDKFEGLYQVYDTTNAGDDFTQLYEGYLKEGNNLVDIAFNIPANLKNTKYYKIVLGRSSTAFNATYDYTFDKYEYTTEIDKDGIKTTNGQFGILKIDNSDPDDTKLVIFKDSNVIYEEDYTDYDNVRRIQGSTRFNPYQMLWTEDTTLAVDFFATINYGATETNYSCKVKLRKISNSGSSLIGTFYLNSKGKIFSGTHAGEDPVFSTAIDHEWGKEAGQYYYFEYTIYRRNFSTGDHAYIKLLDAENNAHIGTVISKDEIISNFEGNFLGQANLKELQLGDWTFDSINQKMIIEPDDTPTNYDGTEIGRDGLKLIYDSTYAQLTKSVLKFHREAYGNPIPSIVLEDTLDNSMTIIAGNITATDSSNNVLWKIWENLLEFVGSNYTSNLKSDELSFINSTNTRELTLRPEYDGFRINDTYGTFDSTDFSNHQGILDQEHLEIYYSRHESSSVSAYNTITLELNITYDSIYKRERNYDAGSDVTYTVTWSTSDERVKENIENLSVELSKQLIDKTQPKKFKFKGADGSHYGMTAQDARKVLDELGEEDSKLEHSMNIPEKQSSIDDQRTIDYQEYIPHLINYVKDLKAEIDSLKKEIKKLKGEA